MSDELIKRLRSQEAVDGRPHEIEQLTDEAAALIEQQAARIAELEAQIAAVAPAVDAQPVAQPDHKFAIIRDRNYDGEGRLSLWTWDGEYYVGADGDCLSPDPDGTLDGYTAEWLTDCQLETRLNDASAQSEGLRKAWRPIDTAPKDGTEVLLIATRHSMLMPHPERIVGAYRNGWWSGPSTLSHVTHWMPLPEAPAALSQHTGEKDD